MTIRLHNLTKWAKFAPGMVLEFHGEHTRRVVVEVNTETDTRFDVVDGTGEGAKLTFVGIVKGRETLEFMAQGGTHLVATSEGEVWYHTNEGDHIGTDREQVSFTKVMNRRARNPELERMMYIMNQNMNNRIALMEEEVAAQIAAAGVRDDTSTGEVDDDEEEDGTLDPAGATGGEGEEPPPPGSAD